MKSYIYMSNTVVPDVWIIEEKNRQERERKEKEKSRRPEPIHLPEHREPDEPHTPPPEKKPERVIVIDI